MAHSIQNAIRNLPDFPTFDDINREPFLMEREGDLSIHYAPVEYINPKAKVCIIGITPGWEQAEEALTTVRKELLAGNSWDSAIRMAKRRASFKGTMRRNLVEMLDDLELNSALGLGSCVTLFEDAFDLVHTSSVIRNPVFVDGKNYTGHRPKIRRSPKLLEIVRSTFRQELETVNSALIVPLGKAVEDALDILIDDGSLDGLRVLRGFPHPSGANGHRKRLYQGAAQAMRCRIDNWRNGR